MIKSIEKNAPVDQREDFEDVQNHMMLEGWNTSGAKDIYNALLQTAIVEQREKIEPVFKRFMTIVKKNIKDLGAINCKLHLTYLDMTLLLPLTKNTNKMLAIEISEKLYKFLVLQMQEHLDIHEFNSILANSSTYKFRLLQRSISSESFINVQKTIALLSMPGREQIWHENLVNLTRSGYSVLQQAIMTGNRQIIKLIIDIYFREQNLATLEIVLKSCTKKGFTLLHTAIKSGTEEDIDNVITLLEKVSNHVLTQQLDNRIFNGFTLLQAAIHTGSIAKLRKVVNLLLRNEQKNTLLRNLKNRTSAGYMAITHAVATGCPDILRMVIDLFNGYDSALRENLNNITKDGYTVLQKAIASKLHEVVEITTQLLSKTGYEYELDINISTPSKSGIMILQGSLMFGDHYLVQIVMNILIKKHNTLIANLTNINNGNFSCLTEAVRSESLENVELIVQSSEEHLTPEAWKKLLLLKVGTYGNTALHTAIYLGNKGITTVILNAIKKAFGEDSTPILCAMLKEKESYFGRQLKETLPLLAEYLPQNMQNILPSSYTNEGVISRVVTRTCNVKNEYEFKDLIKTVSKLLRRYPEQLAEVSENGSTHLTRALTLPGKRERNKIFAYQKSKELFFILFNEMKKLASDEFKGILSAISAKNVLNLTLLQQAVDHDHVGEITDVLIEQYSQPEFEEALDLQLTHRSSSGFMLLNFAVCSKRPVNLDKTIALLSRPVQLSKFKLNLSNKTESGLTVLHDAVRRQSPEVLNKIVTCLVGLDDKDLLAFNLANHTHAGFSVPYDALISGIDENSITIINLSEQYLDLKIWKQILTEKNPNRYNCLEIAAAKGSDTIIRLLIEAIIRAFGLDAEKVIADLLLNKYEQVGKIASTYFLHQDMNKDQTLAQDLEEGEIPIQPKPKKRKTASSLSQEAQSEKSQAPCGGISDKYLSLEGPLPKLPEAEMQSEDTEPSQYLHYYKLVFLYDVTSTPVQAQRHVIKVQSPTFDADYHTYRSHPKDKMLTFVLAGRKMQALIPQPKVGRCVLVLTQTEYEGISSKIPTICDVLVIKKLNSLTHGNYQEILSLPTSRRLAIFLFAEVLKLPSFMMIDDNIAKINYNARSNDWDALYQLLKNQLSNLISVSVRTDSYKTGQEAELGSKLFMINLQAIREKMGGFTNFYALFPQANDGHKCLEDYYMQLMFYSLSKSSSQGYQILDKDLVSLVRSKLHVNAFARTGGLAQLFEALSEDALLKLPDNLRERVQETISILNDIIEKNLKKYQDRKRYIENADLQLKHARANRVAYHRPSVLPMPLTGSFIERFQRLVNQIQYLPDTLRDYQKDAIHYMAISQQQDGKIIFPTSAGKTYMQCQATLIAHACLKKGQHIIIVTPHISLVKQFYSDFVDFNKKNTLKGNDLRIPVESIITVSSHKQSCHIKTLLMNKRMQNQNCILIFCAKSLENFLKQSHYQLPNVPLIFADEYHYYPSILKNILANIQNPKPWIIGCTATPLHHDPLPTLYSYNRAEGVQKGYIAPVIADSVGVDYSEKNVLDLIHCFPCMIDQYHPGNGQIETLRECKGLFFLPSIAHCEMAHSIFMSKGINCHSIHSKNKKQRSQLDQFINSDEPGVLLAVKLCRVGLNAKKLAYVVIGQNAEPSNHAQISNIEQIIGRVMRVKDDKIGYILCFKNVLEKIIKPSIGNQVITQPVSASYLQQENIYYTRNGKSWEVCDNYSQTFFKKVFLQSKKYKSKFKIIPQQLTNFSLKAPVTMHQDLEVTVGEKQVISLSEESDLSLMALSKALIQDADIMNLTLWGEASAQFLRSQLCERERRAFCQFPSKEVTKGIVEESTALSLARDVFPRISSSSK